MNLSIDDFDYELPSDLIAQHPSETRSGSRLLCIGASLAGRRFSELPRLLDAGDLLVFNDTRVIKARLPGEKSSGGSVMRLADSFEARVLGREGEFYRLRFPDGAAVFELLERHGSVPLPPYISRAPRPGDQRGYQTVYALAAGAVAAPTAGMHFDEALLAALRGRGIDHAYVTLHVG